MVQTIKNPNSRLRGCRWGGALAAVAALAVGLPAGPATGADFYKGKDIRFIIPSGAGGGYDVYSRVFIRHWAKHIPGNPNIIAQNMPGASGLKATNHVYNIAAKDGTVVGSAFNTGSLEPLIGGQGVQYDALKLKWVGSMGKQDSMCVTWNSSPTKTLEDAQKRETTVSTTGMTGNRATVPRIFNYTVGTKFKIIAGYDSAGSILAVERGEVDGICGLSYNTLTASMGHWIGKVNILAQFSAKSNPNIPEVPLLIDRIKEPDMRKVVDLLFTMQEIGRPVIAPPDVPEERLAVLRKAFADTMKDEAFLAEAKKTGLEIDPIDHNEIESLLKEAYATPKKLVDIASEMVGRKKKS